MLEDLIEENKLKGKKVVRQLGHKLKKSELDDMPLVRREILDLSDKRNTIFGIDKTQRRYLWGLCGKDLYEIRFDTYDAQSMPGRRKVEYVCLFGYPFCGYKLE